MANKTLTKAKAAKNDEFYTQFYDIETEMEAYLDYNRDVFRGKWSEPTKLDTTLTVHMRRRTLEEKLEAIRLVEAGNSPRSVSDRLHIGHHQIYEWLYIYKEKGVSGLENKRICKKNQYSFEKRCEIIREYQDSELTLPEISSKHGISSSTLVSWLSKFNKGGKDALAIKQPSPRVLYAKEYTSMDSFITDLKEYMEYYNNERIKLRLNGMPPVLYRKAFEQAHSY